MVRRLILPVLVPVLVIAVVLAPAAAHASAQPTKLWLVKQNDLAVIGDRYAHDFKWVGCGVTTGGKYASGTARCHRGQVPIYASYFAFRRAVGAGKVSAGSTVIFDQELWHFTPAREQAHPWLYEKLAGQLAEAHGISIIMTPFEKGWDPEIAAEVAAAPYATVVEIQSQRLDANPLEFRRYVRRAVTAIRQASPTVTIMAGLAPDAGGKPVPAWKMVREYRATYPLVSGFWLNADQWNPDPAGRGCAPKGCPRVVRAFLRMIGVTS